MAMRRRRVFFEADRLAYLSAIGQCRDACVEAHRRAPPLSDVYARTTRLMHAIDDVAEVLTGSRQHFWLKPHGGPRDRERPDD